MNCIIIAACLLGGVQPLWAQDDAETISLPKQQNLYPVSGEYILPEIPDRLEGLNRATFAFNRFFELILLRPIARAYLFVTPQFFRTAVKNVTRTMGRPLSAINALLQGDIDNFFDNVFAFTHNILFGVFGLVDFYGSVSEDKIYRETFDQTLAVYGVGYGSYLVLPFLNSNSIRGTVGFLVDREINPVSQHAPKPYLYLSILGIINGYAENLDIIIAAEETSLDLYAALRSFYYQNHIKERYNGNPPPIMRPDTLEDEAFDDDDLLDDL